MNRLSVAISLIMACAVVVTARAAKLVPPPQTYVLEFNQSSAFFPTSPLLDLSPNYTIEFWVMHENNAPGAFFGMEIPNTGDGIYRFDFAENGEITYGQGNGTPQSFAQITSPGALPNHAWAHIAATSDGTTVRLYVDGVDVIDMQSPGTPQNVESIPLQFGIGGNYLYAMRQLRFWNIALTPEQIAAYSTTRLSGGEIGLVADWPFDDGTASMARDVGRHHLDLPLPGIIGYAPPVPAIRWVHSAVLDAGPFFLEEGPFAATSLNGTQLNMGAGTLTDFNHDGALDAIVSTYVNDPNVATPLVALRNDGNGHLSDATPETFSGAVPTLYGVETFASGDFDGDGKTDLFVAANGEGRTPNWGAQSHLLLQTPTGQLNDVTSTNLPQLDAYTPLAYAADIDGSGHLDIFMGNIHFGQILSPVGPLFLD